MYKNLIGVALALMLAPAAWAQSAYRIQPGDTLQIEVLEDSSLNRSSLVLPDGSISVPLAGSVRASGRSVDDVRAAIASGIASNFANPPTVTVSVASLGDRAVASGPSTVAVYLLGEVATPGQVDITRGTTLLQALALAGGTTRFAATKRVQLRRVDARTGQEQVYRFNYKAIQEGAGSGAIPLQAGDVIVVPERRLFE